jgi:signal transduction histidine kinase
MADQAREMVAVGQRLTQQLLTFGKPRSDSPYMACDVHAVLTSMRPMLQTSIGVSIQLHVELLSRSRCVVLGQSQIEQIILNLCLNARDALPKGGAITLVVRDVRPDDEISPEMLILEVSDTGLGMDEATLSRIFEPYFTTKASGGGLGLATVHGIVRRARGIARASSQPGEGATILVALPAAPDL